MFEVYLMSLKVFLFVLSGRSRRHYLQNCKTNLVNSTSPESWRWPACRSPLTLRGVWTTGSSCVSLLETTSFHTFPPWKSGLCKPLASRWEIKASWPVLLCPHREGAIDRLVNIYKDVVHKTGVSSPPGLSLLFATVRGGFFQLFFLT